MGLKLVSARSDAPIMRESKYAQQLAISIGSQIQKTLETTGKMRQSGTAPVPWVAVCTQRQQQGNVECMMKFRPVREAIAVDFTYRPQMSRDVKWLVGVGMINMVGDILLT